MYFKIGIIISDNYSNLSKIKEEIYDLKNKFDKQLILYIINSKLYLLDDIKKFIIESEIKLVEILRYDEKYNQFAPKAEYFYEREYNPKYYYIRNNEFIKSINGIYFFIEENVKKNDISNVILNTFIKKSKNVKVLN